MDVDLGFLTGGVRYNRPFTIALPNAVPPAQTSPRFRRCRHRARSAARASRRVLAARDLPALRRRRAWHDRDSARDSGCRRDLPIPGAPLGVALAVAGNPRYGKIDPQLAAEHAVLEAVRNVVAVGARPLGLTDCLNFGDPTVPEHLGAMVAAIDGLAYAARAARHAVRFGQRQPLQPVEIGPHGGAVADRGVRRGDRDIARMASYGVQARRVGTVSHRRGGRAHRRLGVCGFAGHL